MGVRARFRDWAQLGMLFAIGSSRLAQAMSELGLEAARITQAPAWDEVRAWKQDAGAAARRRCEPRIAGAEAFRRLVRDHSYESLKLVSRAERQAKRLKSEDLVCAFCERRGAGANERRRGRNCSR